MWCPQGPTAKAVKSAKKHGNVLLPDLIVRGMLSHVIVFKGESRFCLTNGAAKVLLPEWHSLNKDLHALELEGNPVEVEFMGTVDLEDGKIAHNVDIYPLG